MLSSIPQPKHSWFLVSSLVAFVTIAGFSIFFQMKSTTFETKLANLKLQKENFLRAPTETDSENNGAVNEISRALLAKSQLKVIEANQLPWSKIIEKIENTVPKEKETNKPTIELRSYTGSEEGQLAISATTRALAAEPFDDVAKLIQAMAAEPSFKGVFIPSITKSLTPEGETVLSFSINFTYVKQNF